MLITVLCHFRPMACEMYCIGKVILAITTCVFVASSMIRVLLWQQKCNFVGYGQEVGTNRSASQSPLADLYNHPVLIKQEGLDLFIHRAFLDDRFHEPIVRIFAMQKKTDVLDGWKCKATSRDGRVDETIAKRYIIDLTWPWWGPQYACCFDCHFTGSITPHQITLYSPDEKYVFNLKVERTIVSKPRRSLAVCVKPASGEFDIARLVEWFEILQLAGVQDFIIYDSDVHGPAKHVLEFYKHKGILKIINFPFSQATVVNINYPGYTQGKQEAVYQQTYLVAMHDCLYRFYGSYEHLLFIDLDEILLPVRNESLVNVIQELQRIRKNGVGFLFQTSWHFTDHGETSDPNIPKYLYMQRHLVGTVPMQNQPKSIVLTDKAISLNFHSLLDVPERKYSNEVVSWEHFGYIYHFRGKCIDKFFEDKCEEMIKNTRLDPILPRYKNDLIRKVSAILQHLHTVPLS